MQPENNMLRIGSLRGGAVLGAHQWCYSGEVWRTELLAPECPGCARLLKYWLTVP